jgi:uncharacterized protein
MRLLERPLARLVLGTLFVMVPLVLLQGLVHRLPLGALVGLLGYAAFVRWIERRRLSELSPRGAVQELVGGLVIGTLLFAATVGALGLFGVFRITGTEPLGVMPAPFTAAVSTGVVEELLFRGILFRIVESAIGSWLALVLSAIVFGLLHLLNAHASLQGAVAIMLEAGVLLAGAYLMTRRLWLPIGIHIGWNFTQGGVFGVAVSGTPATGVLRGVLSGPSWLSGGIFGAEASIVAVIIGLIAAGTFLTIAVRRRHIVPVP